MNRLCQLLLGFSLLSLAFAQPPLRSYAGAKTALEQSIAAMPEDAVASLDALRQARDAFTPLAEELEPTLRQGLQETFNRAEQAIVNESQTDLRVQATVLRGGFQRGLYERALERAAGGDLAQANALLEVIATDLQLTPRELDSDSVHSLQTSFEQRLATRSLAQLSALSELPTLSELPAAERETERGRRYERLSQLYSYIFVVQDSPRLPAQTRATIIEAIRQQVAERPITSTLTTLRAQLQSFQAAAATAEPKEAEQPVLAAPDPADSIAPAPPPQDSAPLRSYLFIVAGLLALIAIIRVLTRLRSSSSPWQDAATVLLLLPALAEGLFALAQQLAPLLALPLLAQAPSYSLFANPVTQLVAGLLIACAALCLVLAQRTVPAKAQGQVKRNPKTESAASPPTPTKTPARPPAMAPGKMNWDEDF